MPLPEETIDLMLQPKSSLNLGSKRALVLHTQGSLAVCDSPSPRTTCRNRENPAPLHVCILSRSPKL